MKVYYKINIHLVILLVGTSVCDAATKYAKVGGPTTGDCDTWENACAMDRALAVASSGDSIWAKKTAGGAGYEPFALKNGVKIIGGFAGTETQPSQSNPTANVTTIDGDGGQCVQSEANGSSTILRGFTISNCHVGDNWDGGGGLALNGSDAVFVNCIFENNTAMRFGAAVAIRGSGSPKFFNCIFRNNGSGTAGAAQDDDVEPMAGGAVYLHSGSPNFTNCLFYGNKAAEGAGIANLQGTPTFINCTIAKNYAKYGYGGGIFDEGGKATLRNCIVWGNSAEKGGSQIFNDPMSTATTYSNVQGGWTGTGNLNSDPLFLNAGSDDYRITCNSPCKNTGSNSSPALPDDVGDLDWDTITSEPVPLDLGNIARISYGLLDMGAYELLPTCVE